MSQVFLSMGVKVGASFLKFGTVTKCPYIAPQIQANVDISGREKKQATRANSRFSKDQEPEEDASRTRKLCGKNIVFFIKMKPEAWNGFSHSYGDAQCQHIHRVQSVENPSRDHRIFRIQLLSRSLREDS